MYSKKVPVRDTLIQFQTRLQDQYCNNQNYLRKRISIDLVKSKYSYEWKNASHEEKLELDKKCKESFLLLFKVSLIYECTFNKEGVHSQLQRAILFDLPSETNLRQFNPIKLLLALPGCKEVIYHEGVSK